MKLHINTYVYADDIFIYHRSASNSTNHLFWYCRLFCINNYGTNNRWINSSENVDGYWYIVSWWDVKFIGAILDHNRIEVGVGWQGCTQYKGIPNFVFLYISNPSFRCK